MKSETRRPAGESRKRPAEPAVTCTECPVCGSEACLVLEDLGNYCATMMAASLAREEKAAKTVENEA